MRIVIDHDIVGGEVVAEHAIHTEDVPWNHVTDPLNPAQTINMVTLVARLNANPALQATAGWHVMNQLSGEAAPMSRWARLVAHTHSAVGDPALKALNLA